MFLDYTEICGLRCLVYHVNQNLNIYNCYLMMHAFHYPHMRCTIKHHINAYSTSHDFLNSYYCNSNNIHVRFITSERISRFSIVDFKSLYDAMAIDYCNISNFNVTSFLLKRLFIITKIYDDALLISYNTA